MRNDLVIITLPDFYANEADAVKALLEAGAGIIHLRKPDADENELVRLLEELSDRGLSDYITIHYRPDLAERFNLGGIHVKPDQLGNIADNFRKSASCHSFGEVRQADRQACYVFLSPIFDSISKQGYPSAFDLGELRVLLEKKIPQTKVLALGGVHRGNITAVRSLGFDGAALLGSVWVVEGDKIDIDKTVGNFTAIKKRWDRSEAITKLGLQLITNRRTTEDIAREVTGFLKGGGRWVQLRMKDTPQDEILKTAAIVKPLCEEYDAVFIINDSPEIALKAGAAGVHIGKNDITPDQARGILGDEVIIGCTANTIEDIRRLSQFDIDYIGLGPFRFTETKKNLSPVLGSEGYEKILNGMRQENINIPIVAIGGIRSDDIPALKSAGISYYAVSGAVSAASDAETATKELLKEIKL